MEEIGPFAFFRSNIEDLVIPSGVRMVSGHAFSRCERLRTISFLGADAKIGEKAFLNNVALKVVELPKDLRSLDAWASFSNCRSLAEVVLPDSLEEIGPGVFEKNAKLKRVRLGKSLKSLGFRSFAGCSALEEVTIPASVRVMHPEVFRDCRSLRRVTFEGDAPQLLDNGEAQRGVDQFLGTDTDLEIVVSSASRGWSRDVGMPFPKHWPVGAGGNARKLRSEAKGVHSVRSVAPVEAKPALDPRKLYHEDTTKAVQKALDALFPGWKTSANRTRNKGTSSVVGYVADYRGKRDLVCTLPPNENEPMTISRRVRLPTGHPCLWISVCKNMTYQADFLLQVLVDGKKVHEETVNNGKWHQPVVDLSEWAGRDVKIEIRQCHLQGNAWGRAYWSKIAVE